ncbi:hypothetical protein CFC21_044736 [Triticum aestivum]|uniref:Uncharacterized protein n=2 Tax=Triticum aestivum TaxID=4565 RepID=A0A9R1FSM0_WHEAT|nr:uncharacterized protein LOC123072684 [Triticum aestivum]KAF7033645.1 hypothetical protein CFC21_044733 [Triticum aestivum]KAF7033646.1 hypothetical protein CFC21_044734 [Triticum aestivum]KAF7033649.1 hypothetical protein CFC21_044736 [Triticum aestivum]CDM86838.1 unnamed protein product [Triticum aestivum]
MTDGEVVPVTSWSKGDLQLWASGWGIEREVTKLNHVHRQLKSVLTVMEGKEIHNVELARSLREARGMASHGEDLWSGLEYYRFQEADGGGEDGRWVDGSQGLLGLVEEEGGSGTAVVDDMPQVREMAMLVASYLHRRFLFITDHHTKIKK